MSGSGSPTTGPLNPAVQALQQRVVALEGLVAGLVQQLGAPGSPIVDAFFGVVTAWQKEKVSVCPMPFGDPSDWLTADYGADEVVCNCWAPKQLFVRDVTPVIALRLWNTDRPVVIPLHLLLDSFEDPEAPYCAPDPDDLEETADAGCDPDNQIWFDDIKCTGEED